MIALFGLGYVGERFAHAYKNTNEDNLLVFSRQSGPSNILFDAQRDSDLDKLGGRAFSLSIVTLPAQNGSKAFWTQLLSQSERVVLLSTTSIYQRNSLDRERIVETTALDPEHPRYERECWLANQGTQIVRLSGIYGPERNPIAWIRSGRVGIEDRQVNFIHVDDIVRVLIEFCHGRRDFDVMNLADGQHHTWAEIVSFAQNHGLVADVSERHRNGQKDAFIDIDRFAQVFPDIQPQDFWDALGILNK